MSVFTHYNSFHHGHGCCNKTRSDYIIDDEDLVFEMEEEELGKSNDSLCRKCSVVSPDIPVGEGSGGSIIQHGLERPETLRIATANRVRRDQFYGTQDIKYVNQQLSTTLQQENSWDLGLERGDNSSSVSSVEEATEVLPTMSKRLDISNTEVNSHESNVESTTKSPRFLPKFLRSSFSRLISKDKAKIVEPMSLPVFSTISISSTSSPTWSVGDNDTQTQENNNYQYNETPNTRESLTCSPNTKQFVEDSLAKGLPLIPFNYSSADIVEKRRAERRNKVFFPVSSTSHYDGLAAVSSSPARTKYRKLNPERKDEETEDKSLQGLVCLARKEMDEENIQKKVCTTIIMICA
jgi:hypothetical protein